MPAFLLPIAIGLVAGFVLGFFGVRELLNLLPFATVALFDSLVYCRADDGRISRGYGST